MNYYSVSDVHDHYSLLKDALDSAGFDPNRIDHKLILAGDAFYSGPEPGETFLYLRDLHERGRLIFLYGNHDYELLDNLKNRCFRRPGNRSCAAGIVKHLTGQDNLADSELIELSQSLGFTGFLEYVPVPYFETEHYVFTHGFIPTDKRIFRQNWRDATVNEWRSASTADGMLLSMYYGISVPGKTVIFGHYSAARCYLMKNASPEDWANKIYKDVSRVPAEGFRPFFGKTFIALDGSVRKTGFINCISLED